MSTLKTKQEPVGTLNELTEDHVAFIKYIKEYIMFELKEKPLDSGVSHNI